MALPLGQPAKSELLPLLPLLLPLLLLLLLLLLPTLLLLKPLLPLLLLLTSKMATMGLTQRLRVSLTRNGALGPQEGPVGSPGSRSRVLGPGPWALGP